MGYTYFTDGMRRRIGDKTNPSAVLLDQHIAWMNTHFKFVYLASTDTYVQLETCRAAITNLLAWLAWLHAAETFLVRWGRVSIIRPDNGPHEGLPVGTGIIKVDLQAQTKSSQTRTVDMIIAYTTASNKSLGRWWLEELRELLPLPMFLPDSYIICHADGSPWTSH